MQHSDVVVEELKDLQSDHTREGVLRNGGQTGALDDDLRMNIFNLRKTLEKMFVECREAPFPAFQLTLGCFIGRSSTN